MKVWSFAPSQRSAAIVVAATFCSGGQPSKGSRKGQSRLGTWGKQLLGTRDAAPKQELAAIASSVSNQIALFSRHNQ
jgi:hypothetical protein